MCIDRSMHSNECCLLELSSRFDLIRALKMFVSSSLHSSSFFRRSSVKEKLISGRKSRAKQIFRSIGNPIKFIEKINRSAGAAPDRWTLEGLPICWLLSSQLSSCCCLIIISSHSISHLLFEFRIAVFCLSVPYTCFDRDLNTTG